MPEQRGLVAPEETDEPEEDSGELVLEYLPSWLVSLVFHLALVLLLALFVVGSNGGGGSKGIQLEATSGSDGGDNGDDMLSASLEMPSELASQQLVEAPPVDIAELATPTETTQPIELLEPVKAPEAMTLAGAGDGDGGGSGDGEGTGEDDGLGDGVGNGDSAKTAIFGLVEEAQNFVYVFDRSQSMNSTFSYTAEGKTVFSITPLVAAKAELVKSLEDLNPGNKFHIIFYNHESWVFDPGGRTSHRGLITLTPESRKRATGFVASVYGDGQTRHVPPLEMAIRMKPDVIYLLTDGEEKDDPSPDELARLRKLNKGKARINVIQFVFAPGVQSALEDLAKENGGRHIYMNISQLAPGLAGMAQAGPPEIKVVPAQ